MPAKLGELKFISPTLGKLSMSKMISEVVAFVHEESDSFYRVVIGTDSQTRASNGETKIDFVTAVVVHRIGKGARYFWRKERENGPKVLRDKIYNETLRSLDLAGSIVPQLRKRITPAKYDLEIHIDVGALGPTREMIKEVVGMIAGNGYTAKTKPEAWAASSVADKHT